MGAIVSDFGSLPEAGHPDYHACFRQLQAMQLSSPATSPETTARPDLLACLQQHAGEKLHAEILDDPTGAGYADKTTTEIAVLVRSFHPRLEDPPRLSTVWSGLPYTPNSITEADIIGALT